MAITVRIEDVHWMLGIARFHLESLEAEHRKLSGRNILAQQAFLVACLQAGASVFYTLVNSKQDPGNTFEEKVRQWKSDLRTTRKDAYDFFFRMVEHHRGSAAHVATMNVGLSFSMKPAHLNPHVESSGIPYPLIQVPLASAEIGLPDLRLDDEDALAKCTRFFSLLTKLVQCCGTQALYFSIMIVI